MKWITWNSVGIDRIACAWLIKNYIDKDAEFCFIPYGEEVNDNLGIAFDIPGKKLSHRRGNCTFLTIIKEYSLIDPILNEIGKIVNGADTLNEIIVPEESSGIEAICIGIGHLKGDDKEALTTGSIVFDALYQYIKNEKGELK
ncbi:MAG TPA: chromate resistance protein ChrB domain-containing protein [Clostridiaceae bacterium]